MAYSDMRCIKKAVLLIREPLEISSFGTFAVAVGGIEDYDGRRREGFVAGKTCECSEKYLLSSSAKFVPPLA